MALVTAPSPAHSQGIEVGTLCSGSVTQNLEPFLVCPGQAEEDLWVGATNTGTQPWFIGNCPAASVGPDGPTGDGEATPDPLCEADETGVLGAPATSGRAQVYSVPQGSYLALTGQANTTLTASVQTVVPISQVPPIAAGQVCDSGNWVFVLCLMTGQFGEVAENSWVTFGNTGDHGLSLSFYGLHGDQDNLKLTNGGDVGYAGLGAGHTDSFAELMWSPGPESGEQVTVRAVVPENYDGFDLEPGQSCETTDYMVNPVNCAQSGQIGQSSASSKSSITMTNGSGDVAYLTNANGSGGFLLGPAETGTATVDENALLVLACENTSYKKCATGAPAEVTVEAVSPADDSATLAPATRKGGNGGTRAAKPARISIPKRIVPAKLRCRADSDRCRGGVRLRYPHRDKGETKGKLIAHRRYTLTDGERKRVPLKLRNRDLRRLAAKRNPRLEITIRTDQDGARSLITHRLTVELRFPR